MDSSEQQSFNLGHMSGLVAHEMGKKLNENPVLSVGADAFYAHGWKTGWLKRHRWARLRRVRLMAWNAALSRERLNTRLFYDTSVNMQAAYQDTWITVRGLLDMGFSPQRIKALYKEYKNEHFSLI